jgi:predicted kinase
VTGSGSVARLPVLIAVSGPPAAGKSSVAARLGVALALPVLSKDALKTGLLFTLPAGTPAPRGGEFATRTFQLFSATTSQFLDAGASLIVEMTFERGRSESFLAPFLLRSRPLIVHCDVGREESLRRFRRRIADPTRRNPTDREILGLLDSGTLDYELFEPLDVGCPVLRFDTTDIGTDRFDARLAQVVEQIEAHRER